MVITELMAATPAAHLDLWRFLMDIDLMARTETWNLAPDDPILLVMADPRALAPTIGDALWVRVVDVAGALAGRSYRGDGNVVIELTDELMPANARRWALAVEGGAAEVKPTRAAPDVACDITDLGAAYLGAFTFAELADAGRVRDSAGGIARVDALFGTDRAPWCPKVF